MFPIPSAVRNYDPYEGVFNSRPDFKSCVYFTNWSVYERKHFPNDLRHDDITHIFYAFLSIDSNTGSVKLSDEWCDLQLPMNSGDLSEEGMVEGCLQQLFGLKKSFRHLKVVMSVGGWGTEHLFRAIAANGHKLQKFVDSAVEFVLEYGFDGIDIDWEYPKSREEGAILVEILDKLHEKLNSISPDMVLTIAAPGGSENIDVLDLREIDQFLSFWNVMCYDFAGQGWSSKTGFHSNLFGSNGDNDLNVNSVISRYISGGVSPDKLVLGMPLYGRAFNGVQCPRIEEQFQRTSEIDTVDYKMIPTETELFDPKKVSAYSYDATKQRFITYDNDTSARIKAKFVRSKALGGGMWWDSSGDSALKHRSLIANFVDQIGGRSVLDKSDNHVHLYKNSTYLKDLV